MSSLPFVQPVPTELGLSNWMAHTVLFFYHVTRLNEEVFYHCAVHFFTD